MFVADFLDYEEDFDKHYEQSSYMSDVTTPQAFNSSTAYAEAGDILQILARNLRQGILGKPKYINVLAVSLVGGAIHVDETENLKEVLPSHRSVSTKRGPMPSTANLE